MKLIKYKIEGLYKIKPKIYYDNRGYFFESYNLNKFSNFLIQNHIYILDEYILDGFSTIG